MNLLIKLNKRNIDKIPTLIVIILIILICISFIKREIDKREIKNNMSITVAYILKAYPGRSGQLIDYYYLANGTKHYGKYQLYIGLRNAELLVNHRFLLVYSKKNANKRQILIHPNDYKNYNMDYPDSLNWVRKMIEDN
ncbi:MAG: hypothetical protein U0W24_24040 [Bacteroidales bacterium]